MNKQFKKYKNVKWINTRLSKKYKFTQFFKRAQFASILATGAAQVRAISGTSENKEMKDLAVASALINTYKAINYVFLKHKNED